eukprot:m.272540 g.272540  ORF g.272540 m.272540 type:complete len:614 (+) comp40564_c1_seq12:65-1906(+)
MGTRLINRLVLWVAFQMVVSPFPLAEGSVRRTVLRDGVDGVNLALIGDTVLLVCNHNETAASSWVRFKPDETLDTGLAATRETDGLGTELSFQMSAGLNDTSYRCRIRNQLDNEVFVSGRLKILLGENINISCVKPAKCAVEGETIHVPCTFTGKPQPKVSVTKIDGPSGKEAVLNQTEITFENITMNSQGTYEIKAVNELENKTLSVSLIVGVNICVAPATVRLSVPSPVSCFTSAAVNYKVKGAPLPTVKWSWSPSFPSGNALQGTPNTVVNKDGTFTVSVNLTILNLQTSYRPVEFIVTAENSISSPETELFKLNITCSFSPPATYFKEQTQNSFNLLITDSPDDDRLRATSYNATVWSLSDSAKKLTVVRHPSGLTEILIAHLDADTSYNVEVVAWRPGYESTPARGIVSTLEESDCLPFLLYDASSMSVYVNWTYNCKGNEHFKRVTSYIIVYESMIDYRRLSLDDETLQYTFRDLYPNNTYNFTVIATVHSGPPRLSNMVKISTKSYFSCEECPVLEAASSISCNAGLISGVAVFAVLFLATLLFSLYLYLLRRKDGVPDSERRLPDKLPSVGKVESGIEMQPSRLYAESKAKPMSTPAVSDYAQVS